MTKINTSLSQEQLIILHDSLVNDGDFIPTLESIGSHLEIMQCNSRQLLEKDSAYYSVIQDLMIDLETAQEAIVDALKGLNDLNQEPKK